MLSKFLISILFITTTHLAASSKFATEMGYETNYQTALKKAKNEDKTLMLFLSSKTCPWCKKLEKQTLKREEVHSKVLESFIPLFLFDDGDYPEKFKTDVSPTVYFIDPASEEFLESAVGYQDRRRFLEILEDAE